MHENRECVLMLLINVNSRCSYVSKKVEYVSARISRNVAESLKTPLYFSTHPTRLGITKT